MKKIMLTVLSLAGAVFSRPPGFCTANGAAEDVKQLREELDASKARIAELERAASVQAPQPADSSEVSMLARGAGVPLDDVTWRVKAGLSPKQAVDAAIAQVAANKAAEEAAPKKSEKKG